MRLQERATMPDSKIDQVLKLVQNINLILLGNGKPENGLCFRLKQLENSHNQLINTVDGQQNFCKQVQDEKVVVRDVNTRSRMTDLRNKSKVAKWSIIIGVSTLILGNLAMVGYILSQIGDWLMTMSGLK